MPFGLNNAPAEFQRMMDYVLSGLKGTELFVYLDDLIVNASSLHEHGVRVRRLFERLRKAGLTLQASKCRFSCKEVNYLGHIITTDGIKPDPDKVIAGVRSTVKSYDRVLRERENSTLADSQLEQTNELERDEEDNEEDSDDTDESIESDGEGQEPESPQPDFPVQEVLNLTPFKDMYWDKGAYQYIETLQHSTSARNPQLTLPNSSNSPSFSHDEPPNLSRWLAISHQAA
ncbi:uncharacterized protein K02A2.6-like, partial [Chelonus insularis]|uniref:uncharacterized protein K02A2.6-like n=1 Tax=Chelonus insularis TaxID=460826 RepID=UPI00158CEDBE